MTVLKLEPLDAVEEEAHALVEMPRREAQQPREQLAPVELLHFVDQEVDDELRLLLHEQREVAVELLEQDLLLELEKISDGFGVVALVEVVHREDLECAALPCQLEDVLEAPMPLHHLEERVRDAAVRAAAAAQQFLEVGQVGLVLIGEVVAHLIGL